MSNSTPIIAVNSFTLSCLSLMFIYLKLTKQIDWSWWLVLLPVWFPIVLGVFIIGLLFLYFAFKDFYRSYKNDEK